MSLIWKTIDEIAYAVSGYNRRRKFHSFMEIMKPTSHQSVLDVGFQDEEFADSQNYLEKHYPYPHRITTIGIEEPVKFTCRYPHVTVLRYDGINFPFADKTFDIGWSNAVIEHVGDYARQRHFIRELKRTCKAVFFTTPNRYFPIEVHSKLPLLHFLPKKIFDIVLRLVGRGSFSGEYMHLISYRTLKRLLNEAGVVKYKIIKNRLLGLSVDFSVYFNTDNH